MSLTPAPDPKPLPDLPADPGALPRWVSITLVVAFILVGYLLVSGYYERQSVQTQFDKSSAQVQSLAAQLDKANTNLSGLRGELDLTSKKLGLTQDELAHARSVAESTAKQQKKSEDQFRTQIGQVQQDTSAKFGEVATELNGTKSDVDATQKDLADTKAKLMSTVGDLGVQSGLIARNHEDVETLKRLGERNIYEFNITKAKEASKVGPVSITLRKVDVKKYKFTVGVMADDKNIEKKDKTVGEPVQFYVRGARAPYELVVFDVGKDKISGYLSTPKDAAAAPPAAGTPQ
jgi:outer membrane murein-binding lipoprotein Lpp